MEGASYGKFVFQILPREVDAVNEFIQQNKTLHVMRDSNGHGKVVLTGLLAINQELDNHEKLVKIKNNLFEKANLNFIVHQPAADLNLLRVSSFHVT